MERDREDGLMDVCWLSLERERERERESLLWCGWWVRKEKSFVRERDGSG